MLYIRNYYVLLGYSKLPNLLKPNKQTQNLAQDNLTKEQRKAILTAFCYLEHIYVEATRLHCPNAVLVLDRLLVVKRWIEAVDDVRKEQ